MSRSPLKAALTCSALGLCCAAASVVATAPVAYAGAGDGGLRVRVVYSVSGTGAYDPAVDTGIPDASVLVTDASGHTSSGVTGPGGGLRVDLDGLSGGRYRVRVTAPTGSGLLPAPAGRGLSSLTDFVNVSGGRNADPVMGLWDPGEYCQADPTLVSCNLQRGDQTAGLGLFSFKGVGGVSTTPSGGPYLPLTRAGQQGAVFGIGTDRSGDVFAGTYVKRHTEYGPAGNMNAIYRYNVHAPGAGVSTFAVLPGTLTPHDAAGSIPYIDDNAVYGEIGKEGLGGLAVTGDGSTLYAVDLNDKSLYSIPINGPGSSVTAGAQTSVPIRRPLTGCAGEWHPFGLGVHDSTVYVGGVCGAENTVTRAAPWGDPSQERAFVYRYSGGTFTQILDFPLGYPRGCAYDFKLGGPATHCKPHLGGVLSASWEAWNERTPTPDQFGFSSSPQPMLTSIDVTGKGDLVLAFRDRYPDMEGTGLHIHNGRTIVTAIGAGDLLKACVSGGNYALENDGRCGGVSGAGVGNGYGPGGGEFFDNVWKDSDSSHDHTATGGSTYLPGYNDEWSTRYDPFDYDPWHKGVSLYGPTGAPTRGIEIDGSDLGNNIRFGKGNGLADLEKLCDEAPVQIGNRVWYDANRDGIQDPAEPGIAGVRVTLTTGDGMVVATTTTDANGEYYFGTRNGLKPHTIYAVAFDASNATGLPNGVTAAELSWSPQDAGSDRCLDSRVNASGVSTVAVGAAGDVDHCVDAGLMPPTDSIGDRVWYDANHNGIQDPGEPGIGGVKATLQDSSGMAIGTTTTNSQGMYLFTNMPDGTYHVCFNPATFPAGDKLTIAYAHGGNGTDSAADQRTGCTDLVTLGPGHRVNLTLDAGLIKPPVARSGPASAMRPTSGPASGFLARTGLDLPLSGLLGFSIAASAAGVYLFVRRRRHAA